MKEIIDENNAAKAHRDMLRRRKQRWDCVKTLYSEYLDGAGLSTNLLVPRMADIFKLPAVRTLLEDDSKDQVDTAGWAKLLPVLPDIVRGHRKRIISAAGSAIATSLDRLKSSEVIASVDIKSLFFLSVNATASEISAAKLRGYRTKAFSFFKMPKSFQYATYPMPFIELLRKMRAKQTPNAWLDTTVVCPWTGEYIECSDQSMLVAIALLKDMGRPWETTEMSEMMGEGSNFGCARCPTVEKRMSWSDLVSIYLWVSILISEY